MFSGVSGIEREEEEAVAYSFSHAPLFFHVQKHAFFKLNVLSCGQLPPPFQKC